MDQLQEKIRKLKNPSMVDFTLLPEELPAHLLENDKSVVDGYGQFCRELLQGLKGIVPALRFSYDLFALQGAEGLALLDELLAMARKLGFYIALDGPEMLNVRVAGLSSMMLAERCDGLILSPYVGSDVIKVFEQCCKEQGTDLFFAVRTANRSALEIQDLLTGSRHVYTATADVVSRYAEGMLERSGYSRMGLLASAGAPSALTELRSKYKRLYLLVDGLDTPSGNAKNASLAFDRLGHGAVVCAGEGITRAWTEAQTDGLDYVEQAVAAAQRMQKNLMRYIDIV